MKKVTFLVLTLAFVLSVNAQQIEADQVPAQVKNSFSSMFKSTITPTWEMSNGNYLATFTSGGVESHGLFEAGGKFIQYEWSIKNTDLPEAAKSYMSTNQPGKSILGSKRIKNGAGATFYEIFTTDAKYLFDDKGNFISMK